jgi:MFS family permease
MWLVGGKWSVAKDRIISINPFQLIAQYKILAVEGIQYLSTCSFAMFVILKSSGAVVMGGADVLNVQLSHRAEDEARDSTRLGILLAMFGLGFLIGPLVSDRFVSMKQPHRILCACVISFALLSIGYIGMGMSTSFHCVCISTVVRGSGSSVLWINSTLLLQVMNKRKTAGLM